LQIIGINDSLVILWITKKNFYYDQEKWIELINRYLKINKGMKVLDLGCGPGVFFCHAYKLKMSSYWH